MDVTKEKIKEGIVKKLERIGNKLYKYRECNENNFDSLENEYIWLPYAKEMPDEIDCIVNYNLELDINDLRKWFNANGFEWYFYWLVISKIDLSKKPVEELQKELKLAFKSINYSQQSLKKKNLLLALKKILDSQKAKEVMLYLIRLNSLIGKKKDLFDKVIFSIKEETVNANKLSREKILICCLAESYQINSMWERYTNKKTGFCVEYDFNKCLYDLDKHLWLSALAPMWYRQRPHYSLVNVFQWKLDNCLLRPKPKDFYDIKDNDANLQLLMKDPSYAFEKEWRLTFGGKNINQKMPFPYVSAVYVGLKISKENLERIESICKKLGVPIYQQKLSKYSSEFEYERIN